MTPINNVPCPYCNFIGHPVSSQDRRYWNFVCERCHSVFVVDAETGKVVSGKFQW